MRIALACGMVMSVIAGGVIGCGENGEAFPDPSVCVNAPLKLTPLREGFGIERMVWHQGSVIFSELVDESPYRSVRIVPDTGGTPTALVNTSAESLAVEGDQLVYSTIPLSFLSVPLAGGTPVVLRDVPITYPDLAHVTAITGDTFYWHVNQDPFTNPRHILWKAGRTDGAPAEQVGILPEQMGSSTVSNLYVTGTGAVFASILGGPTYIFPADGSTPGRIDGEIIGFAPQSVLGTRRRAAPRPLMSFHNVFRTDGNGSAEAPFWTAKPPSLYPWRAIPDDKDGWFFAGSEWFNDDRRHWSVWHLNAEGTGRRLACDPIASNEPGAILYESALAGSPDKLFVARKERAGWQLVAIPTL